MAKKKTTSFPYRRLLGALLIAFGFYNIVVFASANIHDPSLNFVTNARVSNWGGVMGAYYAVPAIELVGLAVILPTLALLTWGVRTVTGNFIRRWWMRITLMAVALPLMAGVFTLLHALFDKPSGWPGSGFGGHIGHFVVDKLLMLGPLWSVALGLTPAALVLAFFTLAMPLEQWRHFFRRVAGFFQGVHMSIATVLGFFAAVGNKIYHLFWKDDSDYSRPTPAATKKPSRKVAREQKKAKKEIKTQSTATQTSLDLKVGGEYDSPSLDLLETPPNRKGQQASDSALEQNAELLENVLADFGVDGKIVEVRPGPVVTLYALEPSPGTKSSRVIGLAEDIARSMSAVSARIAVIPGQNAIGIELPNTNRETVFLREIMESDAYLKSKHALPLCLGKDIGGDEMVIDLVKTPHLLVAGTTGSGKSVGINAMILSLLYRYGPDECKFIMIDPKMLELSVYQDIPHLLTPVVTEPGKAVVALKWTVKEMEHRYKLMSNLGVRNVDGYNKAIMEAKKAGKELQQEVQTGYDVETGKPTYETVPLEMEKLPFIVVIVDEMADLMLVAGKDIEGSIQRLAQMARAAGIHIILATQRPSVDVITGVIKANFPSRISFQVTSKIDSRTILGEQGAEQLLGMGDMLHMAGGSRITRIHGPFVDDKEVEHVVTHLKRQGTPNYVTSVTEDTGGDDGFATFEGGDDADDLYSQAVSIVLQDRKASTSYIQRSLKIGYNRAANIIEEMEKQGVVSPANHVGKREILIGGDE